MEDAFFHEVSILMLNENEATARSKSPSPDLLPGVDERSGFVVAASSGRQGFVIFGGVALTYRVRVFIEHRQCCCLMSGSYNILLSMGSSFVVVSLNLDREARAHYVNRTC